MNVAVATQLVKDLSCGALKATLALTEERVAARQPNGRLAWEVRQGGRVVFEGGTRGAHSIDITVSSAERVLAHWQGYCEANGVSAAPAQRIRVRGLTPAQTRWCQQALSDAGYDLDHDPRETVRFGATWIEGTREDLAQVATSVDQMAGLIREDPYAGYQCDPYNEMPDWMHERVTEKAAECCEEAARKILAALSPKH